MGSLVYLGRFRFRYELRFLNGVSLWLVSLPNIAVEYLSTCIVYRTDILKTTILVC